MPKKIEYNEETANLVRQLSGLGITQEQICDMVDVSRNTLNKYYRNELVKGKAQANAKVSENLFRIATGTGQGAVTAAIFWLKCQARWKDTIELEVINANADDEKFKQLISDIRGAKLKAKESDDTLN